MAIRLKTAEQIEKMRLAGQVVRLVLDRIGEIIAPGITTEELDAEAEALCRQEGAECLFKGVPGRGRAGAFPGNICASINDEVVHGIPSSRRVNDGDIVSVDFGVKLDGWCGDAAETFPVGQVDDDVRKLVDVTRNTLAIAESMCRPGVAWSSIARAMQTYVQDEGFSVVRDFVGHGIGEEMHEEPKVPNFVSRELKSRDIMLVEGMVIAVEPMVNIGRSAVKLCADGWTVATFDGRASAHFENTLAITGNGVTALTR